MDEDSFFRFSIVFPPINYNFFFSSQFLLRIKVFVQKALYYPNQIQASYHIF
jgi:hypothetical protein